MVVYPQAKTIKMDKKNYLARIFGRVLESLLLPLGIKGIPSQYSGFRSSKQLKTNPMIPKLKNINK